MVHEIYCKRRIYNSKKKKKQLHIILLYKIQLIIWSQLLGFSKLGEALKILNVCDPRNVCCFLLFLLAYFKARYVAMDFLFFFFLWRCGYVFLAVEITLYDSYSSALVVNTMSVISWFICVTNITPWLFTLFREN